MNSLKEIKKVHTEQFLKYVDSYLFDEVRDQEDGIYFNAVNPTAFESDGKLLPCESPMEANSFVSCSLRFTTGDEKPWLVIGAETKEGFRTSISVSPELLDLWYNTVMENVSFHEYLPEDFKPKSVKTDAEMKNEKCPLGVKRCYAGTTGVCRACPKAKYKTGGETYHFRCTYDDWYNPFGDD